MLEGKKGTREEGPGLVHRTKAERPKHPLITHNLQSIARRAVRRNREHDNRQNSDLKKSINPVPALSTHLVTTQPLDMHACMRRQRKSNLGFFLDTKSSLTSHVASPPAPRACLYVNTERKRSHREV